MEGLLPFRLDGKVAMVTGAGKGIGADIAKTLAAAGAEVWLLARTESDLRQVQSDIAEEGGKSIVFPLDIKDASAVRHLIKQVPVLDIMVNNAGTNIPEPILDVTDEHLDELINLNIRSCFIASQAAVRKMLEQPDRAKTGGAVINITSQMGHVGSPNRAVYCMTKHAIEGLTKAMAIELAPHQIRVNSVAPTFIETPLVSKIVDTEEKRQFLYSQIPLGRIGQPSDISAAVLYLASPAAAMVTGISIKVDGGWTAQ